MTHVKPPITTFREFLSKHFKSRTVQFEEIKTVVKYHHPELCDDTKLCTHEYPHRPEWEHQLRHALDYMKNKQKSISQETQGEYSFP